MTYNLLRHLADSYGLVIMAVVYLVLCGWAFIPGARAKNQRAANIIFEDRDHG